MQIKCSGIESVIIGISGDISCKTLLSLITKGQVTLQAKLSHVMLNDRFGILCEFYRDNSNSTKERNTLSLLSKFPLVTIKEGYYRWV